MNKNTILLVDDDENICKVVKLYLEKDGYDVVVAHDGNSGLEMFASSGAELVLLDIMMPGMDGQEVLKEIRKQSSVPVIMLTARSDTFDKVLGLELGADDYITKPFEPKELIARIKAVTRRAVHTTGEDDTISYDHLEISITNYSVVYNSERIELPPKELELLYFLASHPGKVFTREQLLQKVWEFEFYGDSRTVDVHIKRLREKLRGEHSWDIKTIWGVGYKFEVE